MTRETKGISGRPGQQVPPGLLVLPVPLAPPVLLELPGPPARKASKERRAFRDCRVHRGRPARASGVTAPASGFFTLQVDPNGDLYAVYADTATASEAPVSYDPATGDLYYMINDGK